VLQRGLYRTYRALAATDYWIRRRFTRGGWLLLAALWTSAVIGLDTNQTMAYQAFTFCLALLLLSAASGLAFRGRFAARRVLPRFGTAGEPLGYRIIVRNETRQPRRGLVLLEELADPRPSLEEFLEADDAGAADNWWDRFVGYARWQALVSRRRGARVEEQPLPLLPPGGEAEVRVSCVPVRRGQVRFTGVTVARPDPLGLFRAFRSISLPASLLVLPRRYPVPPLRLPGTRKFQPGGVAQASSVGDSEEFASLRDYRPGDPLRRVHWRSWARAGRPVVREYQDEFFVRHALVLDTFSRAEDGERFEAAVSVAASLACALATGESLLDLMFVGPQAYCFTAGRGLAHVDQMLEILAAVRACRDRPFTELHQLVIGRSAALSGCLAVFLGWDEPRRSFVRHLDALGVPTLVLVVVSPRESLDAGPVGNLARVHRLEVGALGEGLARL
jgi:uncharacterized protein (DUF58 family)